MHIHIVELPDQYTGIVGWKIKRYSKKFNDLETMIVYNSIKQQYNNKTLEGKLATIYCTDSERDYVEQLPIFYIDINHFKAVKQYLKDC